MSSVLAIQFIEELEPLAELAKAIGAKTMLEIGVAACGTGIFMHSKMGQDALIVGVDLLESEGGTLVEDEERAIGATRGRYRLVRGRSESAATAEAVSEVLAGAEVDLLLIDAEHTAEAMSRDYENYRGFLSEKCLTAFHDICMPELWPVWNRLRGERAPHRSVEFMRDRRQAVCGLGVLIGR